MSGNYWRWARLGFFSVLLALLSPVGVGRAETPYLKKAIGAYENFEYQEALRILQKAADESDLSPGDRAQVLMYRGLVYFTLGGKAQAEKDFKEALELDYKLEPPPDTSPKIVSEFNRIKKDLPLPAQKKLPGGEAIIVEPPTPPGRTWTWVTLAVGSAALLGGGAFGYLASQAKNEFDRAEWADDANAFKNTAESRALVANVLFGTGGAAMLAALILFFVEGASPAPASPEAGFGVIPAPLGIEARWRF